MLKWYCWKNGLRFIWYQSREDKNLLEIYIVTQNGHPSDYIHIYMNKKPCKKMYQIYNRIRFIINQKMIKKRVPIHKHVTDFGCYKLISFC